MTGRRVAAYRSALAVMLLLLAGCGGTDWDAAATSAPPLPADRVVFEVRVEGTFVPALARVYEVPELIVNGAGTAYVVEDRDWRVPPSYSVGSVDPLRIAGLSAAVERNGTLDTNDFGDLSITDMPNTVVRMHGPTREHQATVYGLDVGYTDRLNGDQEDRRDEISGLIDQLRSMVSDLRPWVPDRVRVVNVRYEYADQVPDPPTWPGPDPATFGPGGELSDGCLEIVDGAGALYDAARANPGAAWSTPQGPRTLAVVPLLPGETAC